MLRATTARLKSMLGIQKEEKSDADITSAAFKRKVEAKHPMFGGLLLSMVTNIQAAVALTQYACTSISGLDGLAAGVCGADLTNCRPGSFSINGTEVTKFGYTLTQSSGPHSIDGTTMLSCLDDMDKWCNKILIPLFNSSHDITQTIQTSAQGPTINGSYVSGIIANAPSDVANEFQGIFYAQASSCDSPLEKAKTLLGLIALVGLIAIPVGIWMKCTGKCDDDKKKEAQPDLENETFTFSDTRSGSPADTSSAPAQTSASASESKSASASALASDSAPTLSVVVDPMKSEPSVSVPVTVSETNTATAPASAPAWEAPASAPSARWEPPVLTSSAIESITMSSLMSQSASAVSVEKSQPELANQEPPPPAYDDEDRARDAEVVARGARLA